MSDVFRSDPDSFVDPLSNYEPITYPSELHRALAEESVSSIQTRPFVQVSATTTIRDAVQSMCGLGVSSLLVVRDHELVGIFTDRDVLEKVAEQFGKLASRPVSEVMTTDPTVIYESDTAATAVAAIAVAGHRHVPVVTFAGTPVGVVSPLSVIRYLETVSAGEVQAKPR